MQIDFDAPDAALIGEEAAWVEALVKRRIIENWEAQDTPEHLKTIRDRLLLSGEERMGRLLGLYQQIVQQGEMVADDSPEQVNLRLTGLVVKQEGRLRVYNRIYQQVFDLDWLERSLAQLRPYGSAISAWLDSDQQDESRLLRGQALLDAQAWTSGKSLGDQDYQFLAASQDLDKRQMQLRLEVEEQAKQVLSEANRKANQRLRWGAIALGVMLAGAIVSARYSWQSTQEAKAADVRLKSAASKELFRSNKPFEALLKSLRAAQQLKQLDRSVWGKDYTQMEVVAVLQQAVYGVREQNTLAHDDSVWSVSFSPDGQTIVSGSEDKTIKLWNENIDSLMKLGCNWVHDYLRPHASESDLAMCGVTSKK